MLHFQLLGVPKWHLPTGESQLLSRKDAALISILSFDGPQAREVLSGRLWPSVNKARGGANLRQRVSRLRRDTGRVVVHTGQSVRLSDDVEVDAGTIGTLSAEALLELGELLAGFDYADNEFLNGWVATQRESLRRERVDALVGHAYRLESQRQLASALRLSDCILALMPLQEHAWRHQMRLHYLRGDRSSAIQAFERFEALLRDETGARPSEETIELLRMIEAPRPDRHRWPPVVPATLLRPPVLVGRERELQAMARAWSSGRVFLLLGDMGLGKSRLLADFVQDRAGVVQEQGRPGDAQVPFALLLRVLAAVKAEYLSVPGPPVAAKPWSGFFDLDSTDRHDLRRVAETVIVDAYARGLKALVIDDLHHADHVSVETLRWLSASAALGDLPMGLASRPAVDPMLRPVIDAWLDDARRPEPIVLSPLCDRDTATLVRSLDVAELRHPGIEERLFRHAGGHPLWTLETLRDALLQRHDLATGPLPVPAAVQAYLDRRLGELPARALALLHVAAVAGPELTVERAAQLLGCSAVDLVGPWSDLESANVLCGLRFAHELARDTALRRIAPPVRRALHAMLAEVLADERIAGAERIAAHWEAAGVWDEAAACWTAASAAAGADGRSLEQLAFAVRSDACRQSKGSHPRALEAVQIALSAPGDMRDTAAVKARIRTDQVPESRTAA